MGHSSITNSAIHGGLAWAIYADNSANLQIDNNVFFDFRTVGVSFSGMNNLTFAENVVGHIIKREWSAIGMLDKWCGVCMCTYFDTPCTDVHSYNNIVGGAYHVGITGYAHDCDDYTTDHNYNNTAHSINGVG